MVQLTVSPTLIEIGFGLNAKLTIEFVTVFGACGWDVVVDEGLTVPTVV